MLESNHKLNTYILKNPPSLDPAAQGSSLTEGKRGKRSKKSNGEANGDRSGSPDNDNNTSTTDILVEAPEKLGETFFLSFFFCSIDRNTLKARFLCMPWRLR